jgi:hypothetical protein
MITRAYQNSKGERQELTLSPEVWDSITDVDLEKILGFAEEPKVEPAPKEAKAPAKAKGPVKKRSAK